MTATNLGKELMSPAGTISRFRGLEALLLYATKQNVAREMRWEEGSSQRK